MAAAFGKLFYRQLTVKAPDSFPQVPGKTYIITGANSGLGLEAARTLSRLNAAKLILGVRTISKGEEAKQSILASTKRDASTIEVWPLDLNSYSSVIEFAQRCETLDRIDGVLENAGVDLKKFEKSADSGDELTIKTNVLSTVLLGILLLPKLRDVSLRYGIVPILSMVSSQVHAMVKFPEAKDPNIFDTLNDEKKTKMSERYFLSKLVLMFAFREMSDKMTASGKKGKVIFNNVAPGLCYSGLHRNNPDIEAGPQALMMKTIARSTVDGSAFVLPALFVGEDGHGKYINDGKAEEPSSYVRSKCGQEAQKKVWKEIMQKLEAVSPGVERLI
ncbi:NAD(P)-binding protein [Microthyrium microscopicum]|uniref:NAD(P)-binding protein n=1 Tax=Microthyrium microscopicum TaxID=703497 RepID=A0A6A6TUY3_9PEZI|nr:NAD(P)-binding protein [Microthyrium microscopicum]